MDDQTLKPGFFPDFFIVGAPRCGTSALSRYLKQHPQICFSRPKEPHYFSNVSPECSSSEVETEYLRSFFPHYQEGYKAIGEGSVSYLYSLEAIDLILKFNPDARFIAMVRNPIDMLPSYHQRLVYVRHEDVEDFGKAWSLQEMRARGDRIPKLCCEPSILQYAQVGRLGHHVENLYRKAGEEKCLVIVFDDFVTETEAVYKDVVEFIGVDFAGPRNFKHKRESKMYKNGFLQRFLYNPPKGAEILIKWYEHSRRKQKSEKKSRLRRLRKRLLSVNSVKGKPPPLNGEIRSVLRETFSSDIKWLEEILGRNLSHWR